MTLFRAKKSFKIWILLAISSGHGLAGTAEEYQVAGSGTGFFISQDGYIATSYHVIEDADFLQVDYKNQKWTAKTVAVNQANDLAIIQIDGNYPYFQIKESETVKIGDEVYTVGYPDPGIQGIEPKLTTGTISSLSGLRDDQTFFQISVPIQPGNSGGPLLNRDGSVIGVIAASRNFRKTIEKNFIPQNINFAVKGDYLQTLYKSCLRKKGKEFGELTGDNSTKSISKEESLQRTVIILNKQKRVEGIGRQSTQVKEANNVETWEAALLALQAREEVIKAVKKINPDDPFDDYDKIKKDLPPRFREWMDSWYSNTYAGWLARGGGLSPGNIKGDPTPFEQEFRRLRDGVSQDNEAMIRYLIESLNYVKFSKGKIKEKNFDLIMEYYPKEFEDFIFNKENDNLLKEIQTNAKIDAKNNNINKKAEVVFFDSLGFAHTDPTISNNKLVIPRLYKQIYAEEPVSSTGGEAVYLKISFITKEPYLITIKPPNENKAN